MQNEKTVLEANKRLKIPEILVVDDTLESLQLLTRILSSHGYRVRPTNSGRTALQSVVAKAPDLILLDIVMPEMDGIKVCRELKAHEEFRNIPVLFISGLRDNVSKVEGFEAGGLDYIVKPFEAEEVLARISTHLKLRELNEHLEQRVEERTQQLLAVNHDLEQEIFERKQAEKKVLEARERAERALGVKSQFLNHAAHELKTPVTALNIMLELMEKQTARGDPTEPFLLKRLRRQADRLARLVEDLLDSSRLEHGAIHLRQVRTHLQQLVLECVEGFRSLEPKRKFVIDQPKRDLNMEVDPLRISQALSNLLNNAIHHSPPQTPIEVKIEPLEQSVRISVRDQGEGISELQKDGLFKPFQKGQAEREQGKEGLGLGLFISKRIVELHGGTIGYTTKSSKEAKERGSVFYFELPKMEVAA